MRPLHVFWPDDATTHCAEPRTAETRPDNRSPLPTDWFQSTLRADASRLDTETATAASILPLCRPSESADFPEPEHPAERARRLAHNTTCPNCRRAGPVPLLLNDGRIDAAGQLVPGTATLVGFSCRHCRSEWPGH